MFNIEPFLIRRIAYIDKVTTAELAWILTTRQFVSNLTSFAKFASKKDYSKAASGLFCEKWYKIFKTNQIRPNKIGQIAHCAAKIFSEKMISNRTQWKLKHIDQIQTHVQANLQYYKVNNKTK